MKSLAIFILFQFSFAQHEFIVLDKVPETYIVSQAENLICNSKDSFDCFPLYFKPSKEFQIVRPGQRIPKGKRQEREKAPRQRDRPYVVYLQPPFAGSLCICNRPLLEVCVIFI